MKILVIEKYTGLELVTRNGQRNKISVQHLHELQGHQDEHNATKELLVQTLTKLCFSFSFIKDDINFEDQCLAYDLIISLGGDGTFLHAVANSCQQMLMGINSDLTRSHGYLTKFDRTNLVQALHKVKEGKAHFGFLQRLAVSLNGTLQKYFALNEVFIGNPHIYETSHLCVQTPKEKAHVISNGILIATQQGSTAFYKSAGGKAFEEDTLAYTLVLPFKKRSSLEDSAILQAKESIVVKPNRQGYKLLFDCNKKREIDLAQDDEVKVFIDKEKEVKVLLP